MALIKPRISREEAVTKLRETYGLDVGSNVYTAVRHVSRSGMTRIISAHVVMDGELHNIGFLAAAAIGAKFDNDRGGVKLEGCGMDMTFHLVYSLSRALFPEGHECTGNNIGDERVRYCPSNDHANDWGRAQRMADDELIAEGVDLYPAEPEEYAKLRELRHKRAAEIRDRGDFGYVKGRHHSDGGYALNRVHS